MALWSKARVLLLVTCALGVLLTGVALFPYCKAVSQFYRAPPRDLQPRPHEERLACPAAEEALAEDRRNLRHMARAPYSQRRYAMCLSGNRVMALQSPDLLGRLIQYILRPNDVDLFLFVNISPEDTKRFNVTRMQQFLTPWLRSFVLIPDAEERNRTDFLRRHLAPGSKPLENSRSGNNMHLFQKFFRCQHHLIAPYELARGRPYDYIVQARPDIRMVKPVNLTLLNDPEALYFPSDVLYFPWNKLNGLNDQFFAGSSDAIKVVSSTMWMMMTQGEEFKRSEFFAENFLYSMMKEKLHFTTKAWPYERSEWPYELVRNWDQFTRP